MLPRDADLTAIEPVDGVLDAVPLGPGRLDRRRCATAARPCSRARPTRPSPSATCASRRSWCSPDAAALRELVAQLAAGELRTRVARVLPLDEAAEGHRLAEAGGLHGKVVLQPR